ncbi:DUF3472 domain-containing protein [Luteolibacter yonseiensis]|uniref:DUF3472 domain-containing protein n=1 Tax=Luteolibacter yonseiensis TaxID=1144680 RepID=A0A934VBH0_9BACT|nr:DUF3472 domain-containing protein [Luteolibacter yonseiensis]MBK1817253.1 DUF3472 domain-containing protein [Luteolibacter yonseiensis]
MKSSIPILCLPFFIAVQPATAEVIVPAFTAYLEPDANGAQVSEDRGITGWHDEKLRVSWFGELKKAGRLTASVKLKLPPGGSSKLQLSIDGEKHQAHATGDTASFGEYKIGKPGYVKFELSSSNDDGDAGQIQSLHLEGEATAGAHFNLLPRRNSASVHLAYPTPEDAKIAMFYNEATAIEDPVATYYMVCGFSRGYFGMQVNSPTERRIIFSVWDSGSGQDSKDRSTVAEEDHTRLLAKGEGVEASVFGNEGTGGHSHLVYPWKTGQAQRFVVAVKPEGTHTTYSGFWYHPDKRKWMLIASFIAPKDGKWLGGLYSFSENFNGNNGQLQRKALFGPQWVRMENGRWTELIKATFSHDGTGKSDRLDRFMGVEKDLFFLSQGGFVSGSTKFGTPFTRPATRREPSDIVLPGLETSR